MLELAKCQIARLHIVNRLNVNLQGLLFVGETCCPKWATKIIEETRSNVDDVLNTLKDSWS